MHTYVGTLTLFASILILKELSLADTYRPRAIARITTINDTKSETQLILPITSFLYVSLAYIRRFKGNMITERRVDIAVIVTDSAKSALKREHHLQIMTNYENSGNNHKNIETRNKKILLSSGCGLNLHQSYQFEYDPPGELVTTKSVIPIACDRLSDLTTTNPKKGRIKN